MLIEDTSPTGGRWISSWVRLRFDLLPGKARRSRSAVPERLQIECSPGCFGDLQDRLSAGSYHLGGDVDDLAPQPRHIRGDGNDLLTNVLFEGLVEEEGNQHHVVEGRVRREALEGQLLRVEVLQRAIVLMTVSP